jgi:hypothetical protein
MHEQCSVERLQAHIEGTLISPAIRLCFKNKDRYMYRHTKYFVDYEQRALTETFDCKVEVIDYSL